MDLYPYGPNVDTELELGDGVTSGEITVMEGAMPFYGNVYTNFTVGIDGDLSIQISTHRGEMRHDDLLSVP